MVIFCGLAWQTTTAAIPPIFTRLDPWCEPASHARVYSCPYFVNWVTLSDKPYQLRWPSPLLVFPVMVVIVGLRICKLRWCHHHVTPMLVCCSQLLKLKWWRIQDSVLYMTYVLWYCCRTSTLWNSAQSTMNYQRSNARWHLLHATRRHSEESSSVILLFLTMHVNAYKQHYERRRVVGRVLSGQLRLSLCLSVCRPRSKRKTA